MAVFGGSGCTAAVFFKKDSKNLCQEKTFFISYLYSEIKTKPKNHGLHESGKTPPPPYLHIQGGYYVRIVRNVKSAHFWPQCTDEIRTFLDSVYGLLISDKINLEIIQVM